MEKERLFKLIRQEEVVLWAGAGFSRYAGFPTGEKLGKIFLENLSPKEREEINQSLPLSELVEEFYRLKGNNKNLLIRVLKKTFNDFIPISTTFHDKLASIPHFKTIITTNFDKLFENAYGQKGQVFISSKDIPFLEKDKIHIFKVHGDLSEPQNIIITKSDYIRFLRCENENEIYWNVIKERLSTNSVLFLGYNLEDINISVIFDKITDSLKDSRKECFLVAPNLKPHKINDLITKGIKYINSTAEELIDQLIANLKENVLDDLNSGIVSADTIRSYLLNYNLIPELKGYKDSYKLVSIKGINGNVQGNINFTVKNDKVFINNLLDIVNGKKVGEIEIPKDKLVIFESSYGGIKMPESKSITNLKIISTPQITSSIDIRFEDGLELTDIPIKLYKTNSFVEIHIEFKNAILKFNLIPNSEMGINIKFNYKHNEICSRPIDEIELFKLLMNFNTGKHCVIFNKSIKVFSDYFPRIPIKTDEIQLLLNYFINLKLIENYYDIRFTNINIKSITNSSIDLVTKIVSIIKGDDVIYDWDDELKMNLTEESELDFELYKMLNEKGGPLFVMHNQEEEIELHGNKLCLGYKKVEFLDPYVSNLNSIINKSDHEVRFKSKIKKIKISYTKTNEI